MAPTCGRGPMGWRSRCRSASFGTVLFDQNETVFLRSRPGWPAAGRQPGAGRTAAGGRHDLPLFVRYEGGNPAPWRWARAAERFHVVALTTLSRCRFAAAAGLFGGAADPAAGPAGLGLRRHRARHAATGRCSRPWSSATRATSRRCRPTPARATQRLGVRPICRMRLERARAQREFAGNVAPRAAHATGRHPGVGQPRPGPERPGRLARTAGAHCRQ